MNVEYVGSVKSVVPSAGGAAVETGTTLEGLSEAEAAALLMVPELWKAADAEAEAVTPAFPAAFAMVGAIDPYDPSAVYAGGVERTEGGIVYRSRYASLGETPSLAVHVWDQLAPVPAGYQPAEAPMPNTLLGQDALAAVKAKGTGNVGIGSGALAALTTGKFNTAVGGSALTELTTGTENTGVGNGVLESVTTTSKNTAVGQNALQEATGADNTAVGYEAGAHATGSGNVFIGYEAGIEETGSNVLEIGAGTNVSAYLVRGDLAAHKIAFLGAEPAPRAAHPTTLADVITILTNLGFCE